jgi:Subtilase family
MIRLSFLFSFFFLLNTKIQAQQSQAVSAKNNHVKGEILFQLYDNQTIKHFNKYFYSFLTPYEGRFETVSEDMHIYSFKFDSEENDENIVLKKVQNTPSVKSAQFNHFVQERGTPNDPLFSQQWALSKINAPSVWDKTTGGTTACGDTITVAVLEFGFYDRTTDDLQANIWLNKEEIPNNNIDDDGDGYVDDYRGVAMLAGKDNHSQLITGKITDSNLLHGTSVAGVIGATGNNAKLISGVNWKVKLMLISGAVNVSAIVKAYDFVLAKHKLYKSSNGQRGAFVPVTNLSAGLLSSPDAQPLLCAVYDSLGKYGILNFVAVDNQATDVEKAGDMPTLCAKKSMVAVTATDDRDVRGDYAFSSKFVHLAAPGHGVILLAGNNETIINNGASFASPLAAGAAALLWSAPESNLCQLAKTDAVAAMNLVKGSILRGVDIVPSLQGKTITGGRLNVGKAYEYLRRNFGQPIGDYDILKVWSTPANKQISVVFQLPENVSAKIVIVNALGQIVYQRPINDADLLSQKTLIDTNPLFPGLYYLSVFTNDFRVTKKFVVVH